MNKRDEDLYARYLSGQRIYTNISRSPVLWVPCSDPLYPWVLVGGTVRYTSYEVYAELNPARSTETLSAEAAEAEWVKNELACEISGCSAPGLPRLCQDCEEFLTGMCVGDLTAIEAYANGELR